MTHKLCAVRMRNAKQGNDRNMIAYASYITKAYTKCNKVRLFLKVQYVVS